MEPENSAFSAVEERFDRLWQQSLPRFERGECVVDEFLTGARPDHRRGITLVARLPEGVLAAGRPLLAELAQAFPEQYLQPESDLHVTILSIEPAHEGFVARPELVRAILEVVETGISHARPFDVDFRGLSAGGSAAFVCGYPIDRTLNDFRERLRRACHARSVGLNVDGRYPNIGAHFTVLRFIEPRISAAQLALLKRLRASALGAAALTDLELVQNDWYMRARNVTLYKSWALA